MKGITVMPDDLKNDLDLLKQMSEILTPLTSDDRQRLLQMVVTLFKIPITIGNVESQSAISSQVIRSTSDQVRSFSDHPEISPKQFLLEKEPRTDIERVVCLAFYITHYRGIPHFKTLDISKLNTEAAQAKFSNATYAVQNASNKGYLVPAIKGNKQISALGEKFVQALPDRELAKTIFSKQRVRRSKKSSIKDKTDE
jgi:hypothetical protein